MNSSIWRTHTVRYSMMAGVYWAAGGAASLLLPDDDVIWVAFYGAALLLNIEAWKSIPRRRRKASRG